ncbi:hypothetical protein EES45_23745 [Streptomyces sp. ADI97-07]|uniref:Uncharacterized protein n=1 Tax=Streptomyces clavifer TaxID=68188 RepID=A0ABS4VC00_9ACTN|nr:hypothetical protein [Streptomyces clavifer]RPK76171.1 hypothetical protein EES45_23745 [Streptomyces sp. ADI97-07]
MPASRVQVPDLLLTPTTNAGSATPQEDSFVCMACGRSRS